MQYKSIVSLILLWAVIASACSSAEVTPSLPSPLVATRSNTLALTVTPTISLTPKVTLAPPNVISTSSLILSPSPKVTPNKEFKPKILKIENSKEKTRFVFLDSNTGEIQVEFEPPNIDPYGQKVLLRDFVLYQKKNTHEMIRISMDGINAVEMPFINWGNIFCCISVLQPPRDKNIIAWGECLIGTRKDLPPNISVCNNTLKVSTLDGKDIKTWKGPQVNDASVVELKHWTNDSRYIYFTHYYPGAASKDSGGSEYWRIDLTNGGIIQIPLQVKHYTDITVSPDDTMLAYIGTDSDQPPKLILRDLTTNNERSIVLGSVSDKANHLVWSSDNSSLAYFLTSKIMVMNVASLISMPLKGQYPPSTIPVAWTSSDALFLKNNDGLWCLDISTSQIKKITDTYNYITWK